MSTRKDWLFRPVKSIRFISDIWKVWRSRLLFRV